MAEKKPWTELEDAINGLWTSFLGASDDTFLSLFCKKYSDERFPESFMEKFLSKLKDEIEAAKWTLKEDPGYKIPKELMTNVFKAAKNKMMKKLRKGQKKNLPEDELEEKLGEEETVEEEKLGEEETGKEEKLELTEEELSNNLKKHLKNFDTAAKRKASKRAERAVVNKSTKHDQKIEAQLRNMTNQLKGCDKEFEYEI